MTSLYEQIQGTQEFQSGKWFTPSRMASVTTGALVSVRAELCRMHVNEEVEMRAPDKKGGANKYRKRSTSRYWLTTPWV